MAVRRTQDVHEDEPHDHDRGLAFDLTTLMSRRRALQLAAVGGLAAMVGCGSSSSPPDAAATATTGTATTASGSAAGEVPEETAGPFPADGSNGVDVLTEAGVVREDITGSFGPYSGVAEGVPVTLTMTILDVAQGGVPVEGAAVYAWHCDREGRYSLYDAALLSENHLRGVQESGAGGAIAFRSVFPGCYPGRWPHIHFEVYPSLADATGGGPKLVTSQIALPEDACRAVYATAGYEASLAALGGASLQTDMVFADGYSTQLATASGTPADGMTLHLNVGV